VTLLFAAPDSRCGALFGSAAFAAVLPVCSSAGKWQAFFRSTCFQLRSQASRSAGSSGGTSCSAIAQYPLLIGSVSPSFFLARNLRGCASATGECGARPAPVLTTDPEPETVGALNP